MRLKHRDVFLLELHLLNVTFFELASQNRKAFSEWDERKGQV